MYNSKANKTGGLIAIIKEMLILLITLLVIRIFIFESFYVPTGSMIPNVLIGDLLIGTKYNYGYSKYSIPTFPNLFSGRIMDFYAPARGDIIIFYIPEQKEERLIKRIIGLPGDTVQMIDNVLYINDKPVPSKYLGEDIEEATEIQDKIIYKKYIETLPNGKEYVARYSTSSGVYGDTQKFTVPQNEYFVMGDNRNNSVDSRSGFTVKAENIIAKAAFVMLSNEYNFYYNSFNLKDIPTLFKSFRTDRFFKSINYNKDLENFHKPADANSKPIDQDLSGENNQKSNLARQHLAVDVTDYNINSVVKNVTIK